MSRQICNYVSFISRSLNPGDVSTTQSGPITLSNQSTPDLTELISLVKPSENSCSSITGGSGSSLFTSSGSGQFSATESHHFVTASNNHLPVNVDHLSHGEGQLAMASVVQLQPGAAQLSSMTQPFTSGAVVSGDLDGLSVSQPYTVMAIHLPNLGEEMILSGYRMYVLNNVIKKL